MSRNLQVLSTLLVVALSLGSACSGDAPDDSPDGATSVLDAASPGDSGTFDSGILDGGGDADAGLLDSATDTGPIDSGSGDAGFHIEITDPESALRAELSVRCARLIACCTPSDLGTVYESVDACVADIGQGGLHLLTEALNLAANVDADVAAGRTSFDAAAATSCVERVAALTCDEVRVWRHEFYRPFRFGHLCPEQFIGLLDDLTPCELPSQCSSGSCLHRDAATESEMLCGAPLGEGEHCFGACGDTALNCVGSTPESPGTCVADAQVGESCGIPTGGINCEPGLVCSGANACQEDMRCDGAP